MIIPVRCYTCGKVVGSSYQALIKRVQLGEDPQTVLETHIRMAHTEPERYSNLPRKLS